MRGFPTKLAVLVVLTSLAIAALAAGDEGDCRGELTTIGLGDATPYATVYYVKTGDLPSDGWVYLESNEAAGLQRGGWISKHGGLLSTTEICWSDHPAGWDFLIY